MTLRRPIQLSVGAACITSWYPEFNWSHFGLPHCPINKWLRWSCELWCTHWGPIQERASFVAALQQNEWHHFVVRSSKTSSLPCGQIFRSFLEILVWTIQNRVCCEDAIPMCIKMVVADIVALEPKHSYEKQCVLNCQDNLKICDTTDRRFFPRVDREREGTAQEVMPQQMLEKQNKPCGSCSGKRGNVFFFISHQALLSFSFWPST